MKLVKLITVSICVVVSISSFASPAVPTANQMDAAISSAFQKSFSTHIQSFFGHQFEISQSLHINLANDNATYERYAVSTPSTFISNNVNPTFIQKNDYNDQANISLNKNGQICIQLFPSNGNSALYSSQLICQGTDGKADFNNDVEFQFSPIANGVRTEYSIKGHITGSVNIQDKMETVSPEKFAQMVLNEDTTLGEWRSSYGAIKLFTPKDYSGLNVLDPMNSSASVYNLNGKTYFKVSIPKPCNSYAMIPTSNKAYFYMVGYEALGEISNDGLSVTMIDHKVLNVQYTRPGYCFSGQLFP